MMSVDQIRSFDQCISKEERRQRFGISVINIFLWLMVALFFAGLLLGDWVAPPRNPRESVGLSMFLAIAAPILLGKLVLLPLSTEFHARRLQAMGAAVSPGQFPSVWNAAQEVRRRFNLQKEVRLIVLASGEANAFAIKFARKRVVVIRSDLLEGIINSPAELRALLAHEMCHTVLDHGWRGEFEIYKAMKYRQARELTCDNAGYAAAGDLQAAKTVLKKLYAGKILHAQVSDEVLIAEGQYLYSGILGHFVQKRLSHPPVGRRLQNLQVFAAQHPPAAELARERLESSLAR